MEGSEKEYVYIKHIKMSHSAVSTPETNTLKINYISIKEVKNNF